MTWPRRADWPRAALFDLDGTLVDSAPDIAAAANALLGEHGHDALEVAEVRSMIGDGVSRLVERAFAARGVVLADGNLAGMTGRMMAIYARHLTINTRPMPAAGEALRFCRSAVARTGVVTNKPEQLTRLIIDHFAWAGDVDVIVGGDTGPARKPAPDMLLFAAAALGFDASDVLMVGDSPADIGAARAAGMTSVAVRGGYTTVPVEALGADLIIESLVELPMALDRLRSPA
jgi:phosphoglycolate phosphatase